MTRSEVSLHMNYDDTNIASSYNTGRQLPPETAAVWAQELLKIAGGEGFEHILDLGCGTGRFSQLLATTFRGTVVGVDPSSTMIECAVQSLVERPGPFIHGAGEAIPLGSGSIDLTFMSMVYHHLHSPANTLKEIRRVVKPGGLVIVRNATRETIRNMELFDHFPEAKLIELARMPTRHELRQTFAAEMFLRPRLRTINQIFASTPMDYLNKIRCRALSSLVAIPDDVFATRLAAFAEHCKKAPIEPIYEPVDLFAFERS